VRSTRTAPDRVGSETAAETDLVNQQLLRALRRFGFSEDEAGYIEARIAAGSPFIAVTAATVDPLRTAHSIFSKRAAVYLGLARTDPQIETIVQHLAEMGPLPRTGSVLVADAASNLAHARDLSEPPPDLERLLGSPVLTQDGIAFGIVRDALYRRSRNGDEPELRYLIVLRRQFRGLRTWLVAIPVAAVTMGDDAITIALDGDRLRHIPHYIMSRPMSRQEEHELDIAFALSRTESGHRHPDSDPDRAPGNDHHTGA
ncbi:MAG: hypothetical protein ACTHMX_06180, partial [Thermomicrobiales bacterium]